MLKGSALFFTYLITIGFGSKKLKKIQHFWMFSILLSLGMIGYSNISTAHNRCKKNIYFSLIKSSAWKLFNNLISANICDDVYLRIENNKKL